eukprot:gene6125-6829_t
MANENKKMEETTDAGFLTTTEPFRDTEDISMILYKRAKEQEKLLLETRKRESRTRELIGKEKRRQEAATKEIGKILQKRAKLMEELSLKEDKLRTMKDRIEIVERFKQNCKLFLERGNVAEKKIKETRDEIDKVIAKEYENEQKLVIAFRRKDNLERLISRHQEKQIAFKSKYEEMLKQQHDSVAMYNEIRGGIMESISKAKSAYEKCIEIAPKLLVEQKRVRLLEAGVYGIEMKINAREDELKKIKKDKEYKRQEYERMKIESMVRLERKMHKMKFK